MNEGHGVYHLHRTGGGHGGGLLTSDELTGGDTEDGSHALATGEEGVAHSFMDGGWVSNRNGIVKSFVNRIGLFRHVSLEIEGRFLVIVIVSHNLLVLVVFFFDNGCGNGGSVTVDFEIGFSAVERGCCCGADGSDEGGG